MGLLSKAKSFFGGHGVRVVAEKFNGRPLSDNEVHENTNIHILFSVSAEQGATVLSHTSELLAVKRQASGEGQEFLLESRRHKHNPYLEPGKYIEEHVTNLWPYELAAQEARRDTSNLNVHVDLSKAIRKFGYPDFAAAIDDGDLTFLARITVDVQGSPFDPQVDVPVRFVPGR